MSQTSGEMMTLGGGRYQVMGVLGEGGMATVYRCWDDRLEVERAIKVLAPHLAVVGNLRARFETEARTMARLQHPNIVSVHDVIEDGHTVFMVMELLEGGSLAGWIDRHGPMPPRLAVEAMRGVCAGLGVAHEAGVIHRDIKPQNVMLSKRGVPKVTDFGIAHVAQELGRRPTPTRTGMIMGTYGYMSPEQRVGQKGVDARADVFSLGATFYGLLVAREPPDLFASGEDESMFEGIEPALVPIIRNATRYKVEARYASVAELMTELERVLPLLPPNPEGMAPLGSVTLAGDVGVRTPVPSRLTAPTPSQASATMLPEEPRGTIVAPPTASSAPPNASNKVTLVAAGIAVLALGVAAFAVFRTPAAPEPITSAPAPASSVAPAVPAPTEPAAAIEVPATPFSPLDTPKARVSPGAHPAPTPAGAASPEPVPEPVVASATEPEPVPVAAAVVVVPTPEPVAAPPPPEAAPACLSTGTYDGRSQGRPFSVIVQSAGGNAVTAKGKLQLGQTWREFPLKGTCSGGTVTLTEVGGEGTSWVGVLGDGGGSASGKVSASGKDSNWSVKKK